MRELRFSEFRIDLEQMRLFRADRPLPIGRKTLDALLYLIENKSRIVTRDSLHRFIWRSERISASTIPMCITEIRRVLGDSAKSPLFLSSIKGRGYQFTGDVTLYTDSVENNRQQNEFPFIGRKVALTTLQETVRQTRRDLQGRTISILGEAGVGKSRLLSEYLASAARTFDYIIARSDPSSPNTAYSIWTNALRSALAKYPENDTLRRCATQLASVLPELRLGQESPESGRTIDQLIFFLQWSTAFRSLTQTRPILIALEDFHHTDEDSRALFAHISVELASSPIIFVILARPSLNIKQLEDPWNAGGTPIHHTRINLAPFTIDEISNFIDPFAKDRIHLAHEIFQRTAGNAFYVTHLLRTSKPASTTAIGSRTGTIPVSDAAEIVSNQLSDLPPETRDALLMAAVVGQEFSLPLTARALRISTSRLLEALAPARNGLLITETESGMAFCHSILRDSLYRSTTPLTRMQLHERIVRTLKHSPSTRGSSAATIFFHLCQAFPLASAEEVRSAALTAGQDAFSRLAFNDAVRVFDASLETLSKEPSSDSPDHIEILINRASALYYAGDRDQARDSLLDAAAYARGMNSPELIARCGLAIAPDFLSIEVGAYDSEQEMLLREALSSLPINSFALRAKILARLSQISRWRWSHADEPADLAAEAYSLAIESRDSDALVAALSARADSAQGPDRADERIGHILELQEATLARSDTYSFLLQQTRLIATLLENGAIRRLRAENDRYRAIAERTGLPQYRWYPISTDSMLTCLAGNLEEAERLAEEYRAVAGNLPDQNLVQTFACQAVLRGIDRDQASQVLGLVESFANNKKTVMSWAAGAVWLRWDSGLHDSAREELRQFTHGDIDRLFREPGGMIGIASLAEACAYLGDPRQARYLYDLIAPVRNKYSTAGYGVAYFGSLARHASLLAISIREYREAERLASLAVHQERSVGSQSWLVYAMIDRERALQKSLRISSSTPNPAAQHMDRLSQLGLVRALRVASQL